MAEQIHHTLRDGIAVITLDRPPGNVLTKRLRGLLADTLRQCVASADVTGMVLVGAGRGFCPGVDLTEYNGPLGTPWVSELCDQIEICEKPVVVALHGGVMGAGFELALAAHARVAHRETRLAMPDVKLGMIPGGGATQRLPRLLGAQRALEILLSGQVMQASDPRLRRLINQLTETSPVEAAVALSRSLAEKGSWPRTRDAELGFSDPEAFQSALSAIRAQLKTSEGASADILRCVEASQLLPFEQGLAFESVLFQERLSAPEARGARHFLMAEKFASAAPTSGRVQATQVRQIVLMGKPDRLGALAMLLLQSGFGVSLICASKAEVETLGASIARGLQGELKRGKIDATSLQNCLDLLEYKHGFSALGTTDLVIDDGSLQFETPPEMQPHTLWVVLEPTGSAASRTKALNLGKPAIGMHPYLPLNTRHIVELSCGAEHAQGDIAALMDVVGKTRRSAVLSRMHAGALRNRLSRSIYAAALELVRHGAHPYNVDRSARDAGFASGPFELMDQQGLASVHALLERDSQTAGSAKVLEAVIAAGRTGRGAGQGFYTYPGHHVTEDDALTRLLPATTRSSGKLALTPALIRSALLGVLANDTVRFLRDKCVRRASDIDLILVKGFGFEKKTGGAASADRSGRRVLPLQGHANAREAVSHLEP